MFICVVKQRNKMHILLLEAIVGDVHGLREIAASGGIDSVWLVHHPVELNTYYTVYSFDWNA
jgi:hypothetical protein